jgi:hypothetical protein
VTSLAPGHVFVLHTRVCVRVCACVGVCVLCMCCVCHTVCVYAQLQHLAEGEADDQDECNKCSSSRER